MVPKKECINDVEKDGVEGFVSLGCELSFS